MWTDVRYTRSPRCCPCSPTHCTTCTLPDISLETLYIDFVLQIRLEIRFPLLVDVSEPDVQIRRHILSSQCQCLTCCTHREQHTHSDTGQYVHCEKMAVCTRRRPWRSKNSHIHMYMYKGSSFFAHFLQCIPLCSSRAQSTSHQDSRTWLTRTLIRILIPNAPAKKAFVISYLRPRCVRGVWARSTSWNQHK